MPLSRPLKGKQCPFEYSRGNEEQTMTDQQVIEALGTIKSFLDDFDAYLDAVEQAAEMSKAT